MSDQRGSPDSFFPHQQKHKIFRMLVSMKPTGHGSKMLLSSLFFCLTCAWQTHILVRMDEHIM